LTKILVRAIWYLLNNQKEGRTTMYELMLDKLLRLVYTIEE